MRDRIERFVILPFGFGCASEASVALGKNGEKELKKQCEEPKTRREEREREESSSSSMVKKKNGFVMSLMSLQKPNISGGIIQRLIRSIKSLSQIFVYKEDIEETEKEMEIGYPTDVKHVTHIGLDGTKTINPVKGWENLNPPEVISFPSISLKQFELSMASQSHQFVEIKENSQA